MTTTTAADAPIMDRLREATMPLHKAIEDRPFQRALAKGRLTREQYAAWLGQMLHVHLTLEGELSRLLADPLFARVLHKEQFVADLVRADLETFGGDPLHARPLDATSRLLSDLQELAQARFGLLGAHYVIEGSKNGSFFLVHAIRRAYALTPGTGDRSMTPYGEAQPAKWQAFKGAINAAGFTPDQCRAIVDGALRMFEGMTRMSDEVAHATGLNA